MKIKFELTGNAESAIGDFKKIIKNLPPKARRL
jgi:hypothetical protein